MDQGVHTFFKGIRPKINVIAQLEFDLVFLDATVPHVGLYAPMTPHLNRFFGIVSKSLTKIVTTVTSEYLISGEIQYLPKIKHLRERFYPLTKDAGVVFEALWLGGKK